MTKQNVIDLSRDQNPKPILRTFLLSVEGEKTEVQYFEVVAQIMKHELGIQNTNIVTLKSEKGNDPIHVLECLEDQLRVTELRPKDEAWVIVDKNDWTVKQLDRLQEWEFTSENYGMALSNPFFEFWLLLHFENGKNVKTKKKCSMRLKQFIPNYKKGIDRDIFDFESIQLAVKNAQDGGEKDVTYCRMNPGSTNIYKLIEKLVDRNSVHP